jgi:hypothetical protein
MSFASRSQSDPIPVPADPPHTITIRTLTGREIDEAQEVHLKATIAGRWSAHGWAAHFQRQLTKGIATAADAAQAIADPLNGYDRHTLCGAGLVAWSYPDPVLSPEAIEDLDDDTLEFVARAILRRSKPGLFETADEAETARKNGSGPSPVA